MSAVSFEKIKQLDRLSESQKNYHKPNKTKEDRSYLKEKTELKVQGGLHCTHNL